ncbi:MAG: endonuclease domain-containing protein [Erythrobacter sp.]
MEEGVGGGGAPRETLRQHARQMRNNPTEPEKRLWHALKGKQLEGFKFRRQQAIGGRIVDFWCPRTGIAIEVDGETHDRESDLARDEAMRVQSGIVVLRFTNEEVMRNLDGVLLKVLSAAKERNHPPTPSLGRRGSRKAPSSPEEGVGGGGTS